MFAVSLLDRSFNDVIVAADLVVTPLRWSAAATGGPAEATVEVRGPRAALVALLDWVRYGVRVENERGTGLWWGYVHRVDVALGRLQVGASLDGMSNRVKMVYSTGGDLPEAAETAWAEDATSVATYGYRELVHSLGDSDATLAAQKQTNILSRFAYPQPLRAVGSGQEDVAVLHCRGWARTLEWKYVQRLDGRVTFLGDNGDEQEQPIGWGIVSSTAIGFGGGALHDTSGRLQALKTGHQVTITGSASNNATWTVAAETDETVVAVTNSGISFNPTDDIESVSAILADFELDHWIHVSGSAANSGWHWLDGAGSDHITTDIAVGGSITTEAAGPSITLTQPQRLTVTGSPTYEEAGATVTVAHRGVRVGQSFVPATNMATVAQVAVKAGKVGSPVDNLTVKICSNSSGSPGTVIATGTLAATTLTTDVEWVWVTMSAVALVAGTTYWVVVERSGSVDPSTYLLTGMTTEVSGTCKQWTGSAWETMAPVWYLPYQIWGSEDIGTQLATHIDSAAQFMEGYDTALTAGVVSNPTMDAALTAWDAMEGLLEIGMSDGRRILFDYTDDRVVRLYAQPASATDNPLLSVAGGRVLMLDAAGGEWEPGVLPVARWVELADLPSELAATAGISPAFVERASFEAAGMALVVEFVGTPSLAELLRVRQG